MLFGILSCVAILTTQCTEGDSGETDVAENTSSDGIILSPTLPFDVTVTGSKLETTIRRNFDEFSWQSFIALNWSMNQDEMIGKNGDNSTVWETWKNTFDIFHL